MSGVGSSSRPALAVVEPLAGQDHEKQTVSATERLASFSSEHENVENSFGILRLVALTCGIGG
jgi:hypothetical protein